MAVPQRGWIRAPLLAAAAALSMALATTAVWVRRHQADGFPRLLAPVPARVEIVPPWPEYRRRLAVTDPRWVASFARAYDGARREEPARDDAWGGETARWVVQMHFGDGSVRALQVLPGLRLYDAGARRRLVGNRLAAYVDDLASELATRIFGEWMTWEKVEPLFPHDARAEVEDLRTGLRLQVQRYGGYWHADVEPVTAADTRTLLTMHGGRWTWRRRPVVVTVGGRRIAGSINGMPHGDGLIGPNDFAGHFCLHFRGSRVHRSGRVDPAHQLMVLQAAGLMQDAFDRAAPEDLIVYALTAISQGDGAALRYGTGPWSPTLAAAILRTVEHVTPLSVDAGGHADVVVYYAYPDPGAGFRRRLDLVVRPRNPHGDGPPWVVDLNSLAPLLDRDPLAAPTLLSGGEGGC